MGKLNWYVRGRLKRWLWRKQGQTKALWSDYPDKKLHKLYGPMVAVRTRRLENSESNECPVMKRPGKPNTGNPFVRFDEG
jgi:hypothetical protein